MQKVLGLTVAPLSPFDSMVLMCSYTAMLRFPLWPVINKSEAALTPLSLSRLCEVRCAGVRQLSWRARGQSELYSESKASLGYIACFQGPTKLMLDASRQRKPEPISENCVLEDLMTNFFAFGILLFI